MEGEPHGEAVSITSDIEEASGEGLQRGEENGAVTEIESPRFSFSSARAQENRRMKRTQKRRVLMAAPVKPGKWNQ